MTTKAASPTPPPPSPGAPSSYPARTRERANRQLHTRYGWQYNLVPLLHLPGVKNVDASLPWREKWQRLRNPNLWPGSAIVRVDLAA